MRLWIIFSIKKLILDSAFPGVPHIYKRHNFPSNQYFIKVPK
jgi:hypothetical protein